MPLMQAAKHIPRGRDRKIESGRNLFGIGRHTARDNHLEHVSPHDPDQGIATIAHHRSPDRGSTDANRHVPALGDRNRPLTARRAAGLVGSRTTDDPETRGLGTTMDQLALFAISAVGLGLAYAAVPGAVNTEAMRRGFGGGFRPAFLVQLGSLVGDVLWAALGLTGAAVLASSDAIAVALGLTGAAFLFALARSAFADAVKGGQPGDLTLRQGRPFAVGLVFGLANPAGLAFWSGIGAGFVATGDGHLAPDRLLLFLTAFTLGAVLWGGGMAALVGWGRRFAGTRFFRWVNALCGAVLAYFGLRVLWTTVQRLGRWLPLLTRV
jgi:chemosensory pili system protein ChpE